MHTLHIEHAVTDFTTWRTAFDRFSSVREEAGVLAHRIQRPPEDDHYVLVELDFEQPDAAAGFLGFLHERVWATPENSPALVGAPRTRILRRCE